MSRAGGWDFLESMIRPATTIPDLTHSQFKHRWRIERKGFRCLIPPNDRAGPDWESDDVIVQ